jgi:mono/diheme cytochrome c family protein
MAATDQKYRDQKTLDVIFAVSCVGMLLTTIWMFYDDYARQWKPIQREFRDVETALNERDMLRELPDPKVVESLQEKMVEAQKKLKAANEAVAKDKSDLTVKMAINSSVFQSIKADLDSRQSYLVIAVDRHSNPPTPKEGVRAEAEADALRKTVHELEGKLAAAQAQIDATNKVYRDKVLSKLEGPQRDLDDAQDNLKKIAAPFDRYAKLTAQKNWTWRDSFRNLPILDGFAPATKINQIVLNDLTIDYGGFKDVPRNDRCATCHLGIDRKPYEKGTLDSLGKEDKDLQARLDKAHELLRARQDKGEKFTFSLDNLPTTVRTLEMKSGQSTMYAAHPRLDLFVDSNSPHPMEKVGCTICHGGQGSATNFELASHTPTDARQEEEWVKNHGWHSNHFWDFPMLASRFVESSCLKCHHQVSDLVRYGSKEEAPKLLKGFNLVRENGCFGCHEIAGLKSGKPIGPDLRLEPAPALDLLSPADQEKAKSDPANPPGAYRKVGPGLRRLAEKTNQEWTRKWLHNPRGFREDTKMPHFYNLSNNNEEALKDTKDPAQEKFPATEISSIAYYLLEESKAGLKGEDTYRKALEEGLDWQLLLLDVDVRPLATEQDKKDWDRLVEVFLPKDAKDSDIKDKDKDDLDRLMKIVIAGAKQRSEMTNEDHRDLAAILLKVQVEADKQAKDESNERAKDRARMKQLLGYMLRYLENHAKLIEKNKKELDAVSRQLADLALLSVSSKAQEINETAAQQKQLQDRLFELLKKQKKDSAAANDEDLAKTINGLRKELPGVVQKLKELGRPRPIKDGLQNWNGKTLTAKDLPAAIDPKDEKGKKRLEDAKQLFTVRGCLACHSHDATTTGSAPVVSEANFGPNLSRIAAKLTPEIDPKEKRLWLVQWLLNPNVHYARTRMPITQLEVQEAADLADWLLNQPTDWTEKDTPEPTKAELVQLARLYLAKSPGMTRADVDAFLPEKAESLPGIPFDRLADRPRDAEEHHLAEGMVNPDNLKWYIAKKSITRLGCYACHDMPGFEQAKPIGTALNDWGKKDAERLAFEDGEAYVKKHFTIVESRDDPKDRLQADKEWKEAAEGVVKDPAKGKPPYEKMFAEALEHHNRAGFLHLKLAEPRSYDYNRTRTWDDRLRMPQFKFARSRQRKDESREAYVVRQEKEEAEAREAVMTFILGLVADNIPLRHLNAPKPDRLAEIKGRQLLDKYNCVGCHQVRPGLYEFKPTPETLERLEKYYPKAAKDMAKAHFFPDHNAWVGVPSPFPDRLMAFGTQPSPLDATDDDGVPEVGLLAVRLTDALRYTNRDGIQRDISASNMLPIRFVDLIHPEERFKAQWQKIAALQLEANQARKKGEDDKEEELRKQLKALAVQMRREDSKSYGGTFVDLLIGYTQIAFKTMIGDDDDKARNVLPPPLIREGERVQPNFLYQFLLKPHMIRPQVLLRMPQFNMSPEDATALVNYFAAVEKLTNPNVGTAGSYLTIPQRDEAYWQKKNDEYVKRLKPEQIARRFKELKPIWKLVLEDQLVTLQREQSLAKDKATTAKDAVTAADKAVADEKDEQKKKAAQDKQKAAAAAQVEAAKELSAIDDKIAGLKAQLAKEDYKPQEEEWRNKEAYAADAYRLLLGHGGGGQGVGACLTCHKINNLGATQAPGLDVVSDRLRPDWTVRWLAQPRNMFPYNTVMPENLPKEKTTIHEDFFDGASLEQIMAIRDLLLDYPRITNMPINRYYRPASAGGKQ